MTDLRVRLQAVADEERRRVVRDLHDGAQMRLLHTVLTLQLAAAELEDQPGPAADLVTEALHHAEAATTDLRELAHGIMPRVLIRGGLQAGARTLAQRMTVPVEVNVSTGRLPELVEVTAYFLIAEALTNVTKHARAQRAAVNACVDDRALRVEVRDDGLGGAVSHGSGLIGLRGRVTALGGTFSVDSRPGRGTLVAATIPVGATD